MNGDFCGVSSVKGLREGLADEFEDAIDDSNGDIEMVEDDDDEIFMRVTGNYVFEGALRTDPPLEKEVIEIDLTHLVRAGQELVVALKKAKTVKGNFLIIGPGRAVPDTGCALACVGQANLDRHDLEVKEKWGTEIRYTTDPRGHASQFGEGRIVYSDVLHALQWVLRFGEA